MFKSGGDSGSDGGRRSDAAAAADGRGCNDDGRRDGRRGNDEGSSGSSGGGRGGGHVHVPRYVCELQSMCAKILAAQCRSMSQKTRYEFLKSIPPHIQELIKSFPVNVIEWYGQEMLLDIDILQYYIKNKLNSYLRESWIKDCNKGITRRKTIWRKCQNLYCDEYVLQKIIQTPDEMYWGMCEKCEKYRVPHHKLMNLHLKIRER